MSITDRFSLSSEVKGFLGQGPLESYIGGEWVKPADGRTMVTVDPGSAEPLAEFYVMGPAEVDKAVQAAAKAFRESGWATMAPQERALHLHRFADLVAENAELLADLEALDAGKVRSGTGFDLQLFGDWFRYYADLATQISYRRDITIPGHEAREVRQPWGPCGFIFPWNFPLVLIAWGTAPALAAGNTVIVKPAEDTPLTSLYVPRLAEEAGIPPGVFNIIAGDGETAGAALAHHPGLKRMGFTGSPEVGKMVAASCGANLVPVKLELGGKGAAVVFDDVDVEDAAEKLTGAITFHTGQVCCDATRWIVHERIHDDFVAAIRAKMAAVRIGHGFEADTQMGPVVSAKQRRRVVSYVERGMAEGAQALVPGGEARVSGFDGGFYVKPCLLAGSFDNVAAREEIFGPVAFLTKFRDEAEAIALANSTPYGLGNSVWSTDMDRCNRVAEAMVAGNNWINAHNVFPLGVPYAGVNLSGLGGGVNSPETLWDYLRPMSVVRPL